MPVSNLGHRRSESGSFRNSDQTRQTSPEDKTGYSEKIPDIPIFAKDTSLKRSGVADLKPAMPILSTGDHKQLPEQKTGHAGMKPVTPVLLEMLSSKNPELPIPNRQPPISGTEENNNLQNWKPDTPE